MWWGLWRLVPNAIMSVKMNNVKIQNPCRKTCRNLVQPGASILLVGIFQGKSMWTSHHFNVFTAPLSSTILHKTQIAVTSHLDTLWAGSKDLVLKEEGVFQTNVGLSSHLILQLSIRKVSLIVVRLFCLCKNSCSPYVWGPNCESPVWTLALVQACVEQGCQPRSSSS